ncbi:MAG: hypothetical protein FH761_08555 [Firmicutes bacterium]|nr:hypothetical protein [Bacillota bacterium]
MGHIKLYYSSWEELDDEIKSLFSGMFQGNVKKAKQCYELYFYWYNIVHEMGHILKSQYGSTEQGNPWKEEQYVNEFAVAFWRENQQEERLEMLKKFLEEILTIIPSPIPDGIPALKFFNENYHKLAENPLEYGYFQFYLVVNSLEKSDKLYDVIKNRIWDDIEYFEPNYCIEYENINEKLPKEIINDLRDYLKEFGMHLPDISVQKKSTPYIQYVSVER